jgi:adenylate kinase family enzyme
VTLATGRRIVFIGNTGAGKSTAAERLAARLGVPHVELDALYWEPDWKPAGIELFRARVAAAIAADAWALSGNYLSRVQDLVWARADTIVWLDIALPILVARVIRRTLRRWYARELLWGTNRESIASLLAVWDPKRSLVSWAIAEHREKRRRFTADMADPRYRHVRFVHLRSAADSDRFIASFPASPP